MKKFLGLFFLFLLLLPLKVNAYSASSYIIYDMDDAKILGGANYDDPKLIASITKIMTCIIAIEKGNLSETVTVDKNILKAVGSSVYLEVGEKISLKDLLYGMMLRSGNDAAVMIAVNIAGSMTNFKDLMNEYAKKIGMNNTFFYNSHGLEEDDGSANTSSAYDMALLTTYAMQNETFKEIFKTDTYSCKSDRKTYTWQNKNKLLKQKYVTGGKTGYTKKAKRTLVSTANIEGMNIVIVTLNDPNDWQDHQNMYAFVKKTYQKINILSQDEFEVLDDVIYASDILYIKNDFNYTVKLSEINDLKIKYVLLNNKKYYNNKKVGSAEIYLNEKLIHSEDIYVKKNNKKTNKALNWFKKIFSK